MDGGARLRITLLGAFEASRGDAVLPVPGARLQALLGRLALAGGRPVERNALVDAIWAEAPPTDPAHALQALVSRLRRTLGSAGQVAQRAGGYQLAVRAADVDALRFERLARDGRHRLRAGDPQAAALLGEAVALWGEHPGTEPAVVAGLAPAVATRLAHASVEAVADLADAELSLGHADVAATRLAALLADHPVHERAAALLMDALAAQGRQAEALARYEQVRASLADALGIDPGAGLRARHLRLLRADPPAADAARTGRSNLPAPLTRFIGRGDDLARIQALFTAGRLVTVVGPGGVGKTRLAVEAARRHRPEYRDGAWMIDLAAVTEPTKVGTALLAAIGLRGSALFEVSAELHGDPVGELDVLSDQLSGREILLLVDNCEHLIDAVARLVSALLARCAGLRVLATSREPLAIDGEALVPLGPLPLPEPHADVERARRTASVLLFRERAAAVRPGFDVDEHHLGDVLRIVRGLDGLPLALELAAARLRTLSLPDLAAGLSDRFRLLTTGSRTAVRRHRTLRAVIAWSWDLLDTDARTVAERIAVLDQTARASTMFAAARERVLCSASPELAIVLDAREAGLRVRIGDLGRARELVESAETGLSEQLLAVRPHGQALVATARGALCLALGDRPGAEEALDRAYAAAVDSGDLPFAATVVVTVAELAALYGRYRDVAALLGAAARLRGSHDHTDPQVRTLSARSRLTLGDTRFTEAYETGWQLDPPAALTRTDPARLRRPCLRNRQAVDVLGSFVEEAAPQVDTHHHAR